MVGDGEVELVEDGSRWRYGAGGVYDDGEEDPACAGLTIADG
jgi:hypothetical protein